ncbi:MAG: hybrid sensor histidine kinase/response regulator [Candidatus Rokuibacteriota bacterium]
MSLRSHLVLLVIAGLVPVLLFSSAMVGLVAREEKAAVEDGLRHTTRALAMAVDRELTGSIRTLEALAASEHLDAGDLQAFYRQAGRVLQARPDWTTIGLFEPTGAHRLNLRAPFGVDLPPGRAEVAEVVRLRRPAVSNLFRGRVSGQEVVGASVPVVRGGTVRYVLGASFDPAVFTRLLTEHQLPTEGVASIVDRSGVVVARSRDAGGVVGQPAAPDLVAQIRRSPAGTLKGPSRAGVLQYGVYAPSLVSGWTVVVGLPAAAVDGPLNRDLAVLVGGGLLLVALGLTFALVVGRRIAGSIVSLRRAAVALGRGEALPETRVVPVSEVADLRRAMADAAGLLQTREADLRRSNQAKDAFLAMLGHELRNPIGAIRTSVKSLGSRRLEPEELTRVEGIVDRQSRHLARLLDDLLDVSRVNTGKITLARQPVDLKEIVERCVESLRQAGRLDTHDVSIGLETAVIDGDPTRLEQVATNLLENAVKYTPAGGRIDVGVAVEGPDAVLRVRDTGLGIEPAILSRIFELFEQGDRSLDRREGGLGLGLTLVRRLTELHGGSVRAFSEGRGRGSEFVVHLPRSSAGPLARPDPGVPAGGGQTRRVLIVEDNQDVRESLRMLLELWGHEVREAGDGPGGVAAAAAWPPEVVLVDIGLPGLDGYAVGRRLRAMPGGPRMLLAALTGYGQPDDRRRALEAGFDTHLVKPVDEPALLALLDATDSKAGSSAAGQPAA